MTVINLAFLFLVGCLVMILFRYVVHLFKKP